MKIEHEIFVLRKAIRYVLHRGVSGTWSGVHHQKSEYLTTHDALAFVFTTTGHIDHCKAFAIRKTPIK